MPLSIGDRLGQYEILGMLGQGGMGEVYRAKDIALKRDMALKALPSGFLRDPERLARFQREAEVLASLDHPNIGPIYGIVESEGARALVLALIEGPTLEDRIEAGPAPQEEATAIARQIADALEYAHDRGVIHRDLKPANVKITPEGVVKVLDFGLAKVLEDEPSVTSLANSPTLTFGHTRAGVILGTAAYMSPEQAVGRPVDRRSDIFSFGVVLYELLTGKRAFDGATAPDVLEAVVKNDPDWSKLPTDTPGAIHRLLRRCLTKDRKQRLQAIGEARIALENPGGPEIPLQAEIPRGSKLPWALAPVVLGIGAVCLAVGGVIAALLLPPAETDLSSYKFTPLSREEATERDPQWSPDGKSIAYTADIHGILQVFTKAVGAHDAAQLTKSNEHCSLPFWSPDGSTIYYTTRGGSGLWAVGASGGTPELVLEHATAAAIHPDGKTFAFVRERKLWVGRLKGEPPKEMGQALLPANAVISDPKFSPDGSKLAVLDSSTGRSSLWLLPYPSGPPKRLGRAYGFGMSWLPDSRHLVLGGFGGYSLSLLDVVDGSQRTIYSSPDALLSPSVSPDGKRIAYYGGATEWDVLEVSLPSGGVRTVVGGGGVSAQADWAPSGNHFLFATTRYGGRSIEDRSSKEGFTRRLFEAAPGDALISNARWAPDGMRFVFTSNSSGGSKLMLSNSAGGRVIPVDREADQSGVGAWSPDGQWIAYMRLMAGKWRLAKIRPGSAAAPVVFASTMFHNGQPLIQWSPAGDWILYPTADGLSLISPDGNNERKLSTRRSTVYGFSNDGSHVLGVFQNTNPEGAEWQLYSVDVKTSVEKLIGAVDLPASTNAIRSFSLNPDGKSFLTSIAKWPFDIWMLEGWDQQPTGLSRFFRRKTPPAPQSDLQP